MDSILRYRHVIYAGTLLTGLSGLIYQVVWQKYLSFLVGSETRSVSLVVTVFLCGLAAGYRYWGKLSERVGGRGKLLRLYGVIELAIGVYAAAFPLYLGLLTWIGHRGPSWLLTDVLLSVMTLLLPTFCMGATIPLLVSVVPEDAREVHTCHAKIYGINTLGACFGAFGASFVLIPRLGLSGSLLLAAAINLVVGTVFLLNPLRREVAKEAPIEPIPHHFPLRAVYFFTLVTGTVTLSLEVLFVRVLGLTIGTGPHNFAMVVGVTILGLAIGSLMLTGRLLSLRVMFRALAVLLVYLVVLFHSVPYWPYWVNNIRAAMRSLPVNYEPYMLIVTILLALALLPFLIPLGTMLPLVYALIPKSATDYGKKCGWMYFYNTLGTALGAILFSYLGLYLLDLDQVYKLNVVLLALLAMYMLWRERRRAFASVLGLVVLLFVIGPGWDRSSHHVGLFRSPEVDEFNFTGWFVKPSLAPSVVSFEDGPDSSVTVVEYDHGTVLLPPDDDPQGALAPVRLTSRSLVINGKADGDTLSDYSTNTLAALLPYLHAPDRPGLEATVIGLGTGMTAGLLGQGQDVARVTAVEISSTLVDAMPHFAESHFGLLDNPRVELVPTDGFKYLARLRERRDIVVSATSPPWVVGVENLFTPEFYRLVHDALSEDGVFLQWYPIYAMDDLQFRTILRNLEAVFPHRRLYRISVAEMGILAGKAPLSDLALERRFAEPAIRRAAARMQLEDPAQLTLIDLFETRELEQVAASAALRTHTLARPALAYLSDRVRFVTPGVNWDQFLDWRLLRLSRYDEARGEAFEALLRRYPAGQPCRLPTFGPRLFCSRYQALWEAYSRYRGAGVPLRSRIEGYDVLRQEGVVATDAPFLRAAVETVAEGLAAGSQEMAGVFELILTLHVKDAMWDEAEWALSTLAERGLTPANYSQSRRQQIDASKQARQAYLESLRRD